MENAIQRIYRGSQAKKIFSLVDYYKQEARKEGMQKRRVGIDKQMLADTQA